MCVPAGLLVIRITTAIVLYANSTVAKRTKILCPQWVPCERRSSVNSGAWLQRFDDVTGVEKSFVAKGINGNKAKEKYFIIANKYALPPNIQRMDVCDV